jgi:K+-sensing histidine kinase KdpD
MPGVGVIVVFALAAASVGLQGATFEDALLSTILVGVAGASIVGGRSGGIPTAIAGALAFDFFHVAPVRVLHVRTSLELVAVLVGVALVTDVPLRRR